MKRIQMTCILFIIIVVAFSPGGISVVLACDSASGIANSFSQYFSPQVFRAMDNMMKAKFNCQPLGLWKIWSDGFNRKYRRPEGRVEVILNWDGMYYIKNLPQEVSGDWTELK